MKTSSRILLATLAVSIALPFAAYAAKGERKNKKEAAPAVAFETADKNKDGSLDKDEYVAAMKDQLGEDGAKSKFATLDKNNDGKLSKEEYSATTETKKKKKKATN